MNNDGTYQRHALSAACDDMTEAEFAEMVEDVRANGLLQPTITLFEGQVLDGWHRYRAALEAGQVFETVDYEGDDPAGCVISLNQHRRHSSAAARARQVLELREWAPSGRPAKGAQGDPVSKPRTNAELAAEAGASEGTIKRTKKKMLVERGEVEPPESAPAEDPEPVVLTPMEKRVEKLKATVADLRVKVGEAKAAGREKAKALRADLKAAHREKVKALRAAHSAEVKPLRAEVKALKNATAKGGAS